MTKHTAESLQKALQDRTDWMALKLTELYPRIEWKVEFEINKWDGFVRLEGSIALDRLYSATWRTDCFTLREGDKVLEWVLSDDGYMSYLGNMVRRRLCREILGNETYLS